MTKLIRIVVVHLPSLMILLSLAAPLAADGPWSTPAILDPGLVLELTPAAGPQIGNTLFVGALFDETANSLELARVQIGAFPPVATFVPIATGGIFALGGIDQSAGSVGFSFVSPSFDLNFAHCPPPCNTVAVTTINGTSNWIDSSSDASATAFFVAGLNDTTNSIEVHYSSNGGENWNLLNSIAPPQIYVNFEGGKRIFLTVDPAATDPATTRNCLFYETRPTSGSTVLRINCRNGASPLFDVAVDTDIPNPSSVFDRFIETSMTMPPTTSGFRQRILFTRRQTQQVRTLDVDEIGLLIGSPTNLGPIPVGSEFYAVRQLEPTPGDSRSFFWAGTDEDLKDIYFDPALIFLPMERIGPELDPGPLVLVVASSANFPLESELFIFVASNSLISRAGEAPNLTGFAISWRKVGLFDDSFETQSLGRWSGSQP